MAWITLGNSYRHPPWTLRSHGINIVAIKKGQAPVPSSSEWVQRLLASYSNLISRERVSAPCLHDTSPGCSSLAKLAPLTDSPDLSRSEGPQRPTAS